MPGSEDAILILEATGPLAETLRPAGRKRFGVEGGTIGRTMDNDWVLPHPLVSGHHAAIEYVAGVFRVIDTSTNGVFINSLTNRLTRGQPTAISPGDSIIIQPFHFQVSISQPAGAAPGVPIPRDDPFALSEAAPKVAVPGDELDPLKLLGVADAGPAARSTPRAEDLAHGSPLEDHFRPPAPIAPVPARPAALIPEDYDPASRDHDRTASPVKVASHAEPPRGGPRRRKSDLIDSSGQSELATVLAGAGLPNTAVPPRLGSHLGKILQVVVSGVMDLLRARQQVKDEFRMQATRFRPEDNNSLKFSANVGDALHNLLVKQNPAYLGPVESFEDAFDDLRNHQIAMLAAMRMAFESMLAEFEPERLQRQFNRGVKKKSLLGAGPEVQYWRLYRERAQDLARDAEATYRQLFGDRFVIAYEEQFERLSTRKRRGKP